jgi:hypothetical protein
MAQNHVIQRLTIEITANDYNAARERQDEMSRWAKSESLWRGLSEKLDALVPSDKVLTIPKLELDIVGTTEAAFQKAFTESFVKAVEQVLYQSNEVKLVSREQDLSVIALYFLEFGTLPPYVSHKKGAALQVFLRNQVEKIERPFWDVFIQRISKQPQMVQRLIQHLSIENARLFFINGLQINKDILTRIADFIAKNPEIVKLETTIWQRLLNDQELRTGTQKQWEEIIKTAWQLVLKNPEALKLSTIVWQKILIDNKSNEIVAKAKNLEENNPAELELKKSLGEENLIDKKRPVEEQEEAGYYINNAGLVLLWQYLPQLFKALGWIEGKTWRSEIEQHQAVILLEYIVQGELSKDTWEYDWTLNKILCGVPLETVIEQDTPLSIEALESADGLLKAAISHWTVLKNTSIAGLQETFLQRSGKLTYRAEGEGWRLQVERKTVDVLLERLPMGWSFSVIKLPWMAEMVFVEW